MKIIQVHNYYQQAGGEDAVVEAERSLLEAKGDIVITYYKSNDDIAGGGKSDVERGTLIAKLQAPCSLLSTALKTLWNGETYSEFRKLLKQEKPDIVHCHNTFPLISPSIYWACAREKMPVVQTLHNYRLLCLNSCLFRQGTQGAGCKEQDYQLAARARSDHKKGSLEVDPVCSASSVVDNPSGAVCELCVKKSFKYPGIKYRCYRDSKAGSLVVAMMLLFHKLIGTWSKKVSAYIALTEFQKQKMIEGGLPADKIWVKPNFIEPADVADDADNEGCQEEHEKSQKNILITDNGRQKTEDRTRKTEDETRSALPTSNLQPPTSRSYALFVGRLSPEKGCDVLIRAWHKFTSHLPPPTSHLATAPQLLIVGDGPERESLEALASHPTFARHSLGDGGANILPPTIHFLGRKPKNEVLSLMHDAKFLIFSSIWFETFGLTVLEAGMEGVPSIVSNPTTTAGLVNDGQTGLLFQMDDAQQLATKIEWAFWHPDKMKKMGVQAREAFSGKYSAEINYEQLLGIYHGCGVSPII